MRLGGPIVLKDLEPDLWAQEHVRLGYSAAYVPAKTVELAKAYAKAAAVRGIVLAEVGAWSNPISPSEAERAKAMEQCCSQLYLADCIGARCCVNIAGSRGMVWDGPDSRNLSTETFDMVVQCVRQIIDTVQPTRSFYTLETMPWVFPDSPQSYLELLRAIDRRQFAVHLDVVNMINCPSRAYQCGDFIRECFRELGRHIKSCHAKDIRFTQHLTLHLDECRPGEGLMDYGAFLGEANKLEKDLPVMLEHLPSADEYAAAASHLRKVATEVEVEFI